MQKMNVMNQSGDELDVDLVFAFNCQKTKKTYVALDYKKNVFEKTSSYNNLDLLEVTNQKANTIYVSEIQDSEWEEVKQALQYEIFANIKRQ